MKRITALLALSSAASMAANPVYFPDPSPNAPYSTAVRVGDVLYLAGQIGDRSDGTLAQGFDGQAKQTMDNIGHVLKAHRLTFDDLFKCTVMLRDIGNWGRFNAIYRPYFKPGRLPARSAFGSTGLAMGAEMEVECWAYAGKKKSA